MVIFDKLKSIWKVFQEVGKIEQYRVISDLQKQILEMQKKIDSLEIENKKIKDSLEFQDDLIYENNACWKSKDGKKDGPYCSCCWDDQKKTIRMLPCGNPEFYHCPKCKITGVLIYPDRKRPVVVNTFKNYNI